MNVNVNLTTKPPRVRTALTLEGSPRTKLVGSRPERCAERCACAPSVAPLVTRVLVGTSMTHHRRQQGRSRVAQEMPDLPAPLRWWGAYPHRKGPAGRV